MSKQFKIQMVSFEEFKDWVPMGATHEERLYLTASLCRELAKTLFYTVPNKPEFIYWICPGCGVDWSLTLGEKPVSGWINPRWVRSGDDEHITLMPSLMCPRLKNTTPERALCNLGHYWAKDGYLVTA